MNKKDKLTEATSRALMGKLNEVYIKQYVETFDELYDSSWGPAIEVLDKIAENDLEDALMDWLEDLGTEDAPIDRTDLNDYIIFQSEDIYDALGLDENGDPIEDDLDESKKIEARNPENDDINDKIRKTIHGSKRYEDELKKKGLKVYRGTPVTVDGPNGIIDSHDLKTAPADMDLYNYLTKDKVKPEVTSNGNAGYFTKSARKEYANDPFMKDPFYTTIGNNDKLAGKGDSNDVSKAIPKKYKTGKSSHTSNDFPKSSNNFTGVTSYEPLTNKELDDFKANKEALKDRDKKINDIQDDYAEQEKDVQNVRDKITKSKERRNKQEARSHKEDNERVAPRISAETEYMDNNAEIMCGYIADLFTNESEDLYSNFESFTDWCEEGNVFRNADFPEDKCKELDKMLKEIAPLVDEVSSVLYKYVDKD